MRVLVTGGTGFVGAHVVAALLRDGHGVRLFARSKGRVAPALEPLGVSPDRVEIVEGDLEDSTTIGPALHGCDAVVHAASVFSFDPREADRMARVNLVGTKAVLAAAHAAGCDPIVHVSSTLAVVPTDQDVIGPDTPPGNSDPELAPYSSSKSAQEAVARSMQEQGAPVVTVLPGSVWGPNDPYDGESVGMARAIARRQMPMTVRGGLGVVDVRDVADVIAAVVREGPGKGPRRYTAGGHSQTLSDLHRGIGAVLGKTLVTLPAPFGAAILLARAARVLQRRVRTRLPISTEQVYVMRALRPIDDTRTVEDLGVTFRPFEATLRDQLGWMQAAGRL